MSEFDSNTPEGFRVIPGYPRYAINKSGSVLSICMRGSGAKTNRCWTDAKQLAFAADRNGYKRVTLCRNGRSQRLFVHVLVLTTFVGPCPEGMECRHLDGCNTNNHVDNLAWGTVAENHKDKILHGTVGFGERNGSAKLGVEAVLTIRQRAANGESSRSIAKDFAVSQVTVSKIVRRAAWSHV